MRDFLIYTSAGLNSNVHLWANAADRNYDVWITNYSDVKNNLREYADYYNEEKGAKFPNFKKVATAHPELLERYKAIMVADDDIIISSDKLNKMFELIETEDLWVVAPAYSRWGKISHRTTERQLTTRYRYTNFAEVTCPIIRSDKLMSFMEVYDAELVGYGVDWWYLNHFGKDVRDKIVISDESYCINPRDDAKGGLREIDKVSTGDERVRRWREKSKKLNIDEFEQKIYKVAKRKPAEIILDLPGYALEQVVWFLTRSKFAKSMKMRAKVILGRA